MTKNFETELSAEMQQAKESGNVFTFDSANRQEPAKESTDEDEGRSISRIKALMRYARGFCQSAEAKELAEHIETNAVSKMDFNDGSFDDALIVEILESAKNDPKVRDELSLLERNIEKSFKTPINTHRKPIAEVLKHQDNA